MGVDVGEYTGSAKPVWMHDEFDDAETDSDEAAERDQRLDENYDLQVRDIAKPDEKEYS